MWRCKHWWPVKPPGLAAAEAGVDRGTLYRWRTQDEVFMQALEDWRQEAHNHCRDRMLGIADKAIDAVSAGLEKGDARLGFRILLDLNKSRDSDGKVADGKNGQTIEKKRDPECEMFDKIFQKMSCDQMQRIPELMLEMIEIDNARQKQAAQAAAGRVVQSVIDHKSQVAQTAAQADGAHQKNL